MGGSLGGSKSSGSSSSSQNVMSQQIPFLQQLWGMATGNVGQNDYQSQIGGAAQNSSDLLNSLFGSQSQLQQQQAGGGAYGDSQQYIDKMMSMMGQPSQTGQMYNSIVGGEGNSYVDPLIKQMQGDSAQNLATMQNANSMDATMAGQSGSSRQAMQNAMMGSQSSRDLATQEAALRQGSYDTDLNLKLGIAQNADSNRQSEQDRLANMVSGAQGAQNNAGNYSSLLQSIAGSGMQPWLQAQQGSWNPLNNLASILGNPTILSNGSSSSKSKGFGSSGGVWG